MVNSNTLLLNSMNAPQQKGGSDIAPTPHFHHRSPHQLLAMTASFEHNPQMNRISPRWINHNIDPILHHCQVDTDHHGVLNHRPSPPTIHRDHDTRINLALGGAPGGGQTKIRQFLHVRGSANLAPHHKKEISHQANSKEEFTNNSNTNMASTMTARPLPMEYLPSRRMNITNVSRGQSRSSRIRSRSIAIKRPTNEEQMEEIRLNSLAAEYDWATWRMYNRIIEHRQKHPLPYVGNEETAASKFETTTATTTEEGSIALVSDDDENLQEENLQQQHYPEYGEVFDLDL